MSKVLCNITTLSDETNYSAPVPFIGLYIATASLVCFLFILWDVVDGLRHRKKWLPCRLFSLNSVTLTLVAIAAKLPVDLTTPMPTAQDQLSKLTGTTLICACMGFLLPSLGSNRTSECFTDMVALSIFVVTVIINICMQIGTGLIVTLIVEHVIVMCCMLLLLSVLWSTTWPVNEKKRQEVVRKRLLFEHGECGSWLQQLKVCHLFAYESNIQLQVCTSNFSTCISLVCSICLVVMIEASLRSPVIEELKLSCDALSDYGWSMKMIVATQILVVLLASIATLFRSIAVAHLRSTAHLRSITVIAQLRAGESPYGQLPLVFKTEILRNFRYLKVDATEYLNIVFNLVTSFTVAVMYYPLKKLDSYIVPVSNKCYKCFKGKHTKEVEEATQEYTNLIFLTKRSLLLEGLGGMVLFLQGRTVNKWTVEKCGDDTKRWVTKSTKGNYCSLKNLLSKRPPSQVTVSFDYLHLVFLVKLISVATPPRLSGDLTKSFGGVFDIIHFVDKKMNPKRTWRSKLGKAMWKGKDLSFFLPKMGLDEHQSDLERALKIIQNLGEKMFTDDVWSAIKDFTNAIKGRVHGTIEELYDYMEQLFIDMLYEVLRQLPNAIYKEITGSDIEDYQERAGHMLKLICQVQSLELEDVVEWSYPSESKITAMITPGWPLARTRAGSESAHNDYEEIQVEQA